MKIKISVFTFVYINNWSSLQSIIINVIITIINSILLIRSVYMR